MSGEQLQSAVKNTVAVNKYVGNIRRTRTGAASVGHLAVVRGEQPGARKDKTLETYVVVNQGTRVDYAGELAVGLTGTDKPDVALVALDIREETVKRNPALIIDAMSTILASRTEASITLDAETESTYGKLLQHAGFMAVEASVAEAA